MPSPQIGEQTDGVPVQDQFDSIWQVALHPSPGAMFPLP